jgi:UDP-glucuronate 4-epimerase
MNILITWSSGFIWFHTAKRLLEEWKNVIGFDNENDYYDINLKQKRRAILESYKNFRFYKGNIEDLEQITQVFNTNTIDKVLNLAAQAWVRYSTINPYAYIQTNIVGFHNLIELAKQHKVKNFVYASSASVYGNNKKIPFSVWDKTEEPLSLYGATKKSNELIAHSYSLYFKLATIWLRFFNVYGPRGRPDGAFFIFAKAILEGNKFPVYNEWKTIRNFTYIEDIVDGIRKALDHTTTYEIFNLGNTNTVELNYMISCLETECWKTWEKEYLPADIADIPESGVDIKHTQEILWWNPSTPIETWIQHLIKRYTEYYWYNA